MTDESSGAAAGVDHVPDFVADVFDRSDFVAVKAIQGQAKPQNRTMVDACQNATLPASDHH